MALPFANGFFGGLNTWRDGAQLHVEGESVKFNLNQKKIMENMVSAKQLNQLNSNLIC